MNILSFVLLLFFACRCGYSADSVAGVAGLYRAPAGSVDGREIWIVDGSAIRREVYREFVYGGNGQRYRFVPAGEIWVDNAVDAEEFGYTVAHELRERALMAQQGMTYADAHDSALALERVLRLNDREAARRHESSLSLVSPVDGDGLKEIRGLPDSIRLEKIYRVPLGSRKGMNIWIVDGAAVRRDVFPDFGFSGNDLAYRFIPRGEIWIDAQISCEETEFSIATELAERAFMAGGETYDDAYERALSAVATLRRNAAKAAAAKPRVIVPRPPDRDVGTGPSGGIQGDPRK